MALARWHRGEGGQSLEGMPMMQLAYELGKTVDELECSDQFWISRMLLDQQARSIAAQRTDKDFYLRIAELDKIASQTNEATKATD